MKEFRYNPKSVKLYLVLGSVCCCLGVILLFAGGGSGAALFMPIVLYFLMKGMIPLKVDGDRFELKLAPIRSAVFFTKSDLKEFREEPKILLLTLKDGKEMKIPKALFGEFDLPEVIDLLRGTENDPAGTAPAEEIN